MAEHINSQGERIAVEARKMNGIAPVHCLVIYDDAPPHGTGQAAPMLLDRGTREWLKERIAELDAAEAVVGTPISELSGRPGHPGFQKFTDIAASWGHD